MIIITILNYNISYVIVLLCILASFCQLLLNEYCILYCFRDSMADPGLGFLKNKAKANH